MSWRWIARVVTALTLLAAVAAVWAGYVASDRAFRTLSTCGSVLRLPVESVVDRSRTGDPLTVVVRLPNGKEREVQVDPVDVGGDTVAVVTCAAQDSPVLALSQYRGGPNVLYPVVATLGFVCVAAVIVFWVLRAP